MRNRLCSRSLIAIFALAAALIPAGCGYHVAGHASALPSEWNTIAIPAFKNDTTRYRIEQRFTAARRVLQVDGSGEDAGSRQHREGAVADAEESGRGLG